MRYRSNRRPLFRFSARLLVFGLWIVMFGLVLLYFAVEMLSALSSVESGGLATASGVGLGGMIVESTLVLYRGGFFTLGLGGLLMAFGGFFIVSVVR